MGDLYTIIEEKFEWDDNYKRVDHQGEWDVQTLMAIIPTELVEYIIRNIKTPRGMNEKDIPCWMLENKENFLVKTAWNYIRHKDEPNSHKWIWINKIPFIMNFMMWRLWKFKVLVDDRLRR